MTKAELISKVSLNTGQPSTDVREVLESAFSEIKKSVINGEGFYCRGFGTMGRKHRAQKTGRNISMGTAIVVAAHDIPHFKPAKEFAEEVKSN